MCSDDLVKTEQGLKNKHPHAVEILVVQGMLEPGDVLTKAGGLTPDAYLREASQLDAELLVGRVSAYIEKKYQIPLPKALLNKLIEEVLSVIRELAVEAEAKDRKLHRLDQLKQLAQVKRGREKKKKVEDTEEPLT